MTLQGGSWDCFRLSAQPLLGSAVGPSVLLTSIDKRVGGEPMLSALAHCSAEAYSYCLDKLFLRGCGGNQLRCGDGLLREREWEWMSCEDQQRISRRVEAFSEKKISKPECRR